jgi:hypothetical protein
LFIPLLVAEKLESAKDRALSDLAAARADLTAAQAERVALEERQSGSGAT